jgi:hypothetical protein
MTRGLLVGKDYEAGKSIRGIWGLYGSYDYIAPQIFRVSSTALSLGTTAERRLSSSIAIRGSALAGVGYTAVGTTRANATELEYHYGLAPQALLSFRVIFGERSSFDLTAREYFVSDVAAGSRGGRDNIFRVDASYTLRIKRQHAVTIKYLGNRRDAYFPDLGSRKQSRGTIGIFYTFLGQDGFGNADWRPNGATIGCGDLGRRRSQPLNAQSFAICFASAICCDVISFATMSRFAAAVALPEAAPRLNHMYART